MPIISIIIPAFNAEKTILETIESVQKQTFSDFEIIVINDGSTDSTIKTLKDIEDSRLRIFSYENSGVSIARNRGIEKAKGDFISFLDSDDLWSPEKLEYQLKSLREDPEAGVCFSWVYFMEAQEKSNVLHRCRPIIYEGDVYPRLLTGDFIYTPSNPLIRKEAINSVGGFDTSLKGCEDWEYWLRLAKKWHFITVPRYQIFYRRSSGSMSSQVAKQRDGCLAAIDKAFQSVPPELQFLRKNCMTNFNLYCANLYLQHCRELEGSKQATQHTWQAIILTPSLLLSVGIYKQLIKICMSLLIPPKFISVLSKISRQLSKISASDPKDLGI